MFISPRLSILLFCALATVVYADYYSEGWKPGQAVRSTTASNNAPVYTPGAAGGGSPRPKMGLVDTLLSTGPIGSLLNSVGLNMTQKILEAQVQEDNKWDKRIPLINDDNYNDLIVNAEPSSEDEVWFIIISTTSAKKDALSTIFDQRFDEAFNLTAIQKDLYHVKWGRIDYYNVTRITTKWNVWRGPMLVVVADHGKSLRFLHARQLRPEPELMRTWLESGGYLKLPQWKSIYGPGGSREWIMDYFAAYCVKQYRIMTMVPGWVLYIASGAIATFLVQLLHRGSVASQEKYYAAKRAKEARSAQAPATTVSEATGRQTNSSKGSSKKSGRKAK